MKLEPCVILKLCLNVSVAEHEYPYKHNFCKNVYISEHWPFFISSTTYLTSTSALDGFGKGIGTIFPDFAAEYCIYTFEWQKNQ